MTDEEYDKFYKRNAKELSQAIGRLLVNDIIPKHEKRIYMLNLDKSIEKLESILKND